jgi:redox-sensitive bicupin YhaK (pirin superfamily)
MGSDDPTILQTVPLGLHWPTIDPFLFCAHHHDDYPSGDGRLGPAASLEGRPLGMDFEGIDGWRMYHGRHVPGFPQHPHRGFETVTYVREGVCDHADSLGATARFGEGDVQWLTTGAGIVHSEMFPLRSTEHRNPLELFQIWLNLPAADKMTDPDFTMLWSETIPRLRHVDDQGRATEVVVIAGRYGDVSAPPPPRASWAAHPESDVGIWHLHLDAGATLVLPEAAQGTVRTLYVFDGPGIELDGVDLPRNTGSVLRADRPVLLRSTGGAECLVLQGRPIGEPVVQQGPFVLADEAGLRQAFIDFQRTGFGGWPWPSDDPTHPAHAERFAIHPDGRRDDPVTAS